MKTNTFLPARWLVIRLVCLGGLALVSFNQIWERYSISQLREDPPSLPVPALKQSTGTSCGEAVITMTYNFAYPESGITEAQVISFATANDYYTPNHSPYTSPANMIKIAKYYTNDISTGIAFSAAQGLALLNKRLRDGDPVIIDVLSNFQDPESEAHFIVVTGISTDPNRQDAIVIHYNDPLTGMKETADWAGATGVWNTWHTNRDPGGAGWWMVISHP